MLLPFCLSHFNSIKVRLEHAKIDVVQVQPKFQFHKGAIRTSSLQHLTRSVATFQFHKGAIRTEIAAMAQDSKRYFNSIKVRLER